MFHRVDDLELMAASRAAPLMMRLPVYDGAVRFAVHYDNAPENHEQPSSEPDEPSVAPTADQLQAMNTNPLYGPLPGQTVGLFDVVKVPA